MSDTETSAEVDWEYGFYDSEDPSMKIWWYLFGLPHKTAESARHTAHKWVLGEAMIVCRRSDLPEVWMLVPDDGGPS